MLKSTALALPGTVEHLVVASGVPLVWPNVRRGGCWAVLGELAQDSDRKRGRGGRRPWPGALLVGRSADRSHETAETMQIPAMELVLRGVEKLINKFSCLLSTTKKSGATSARARDCTGVTLCWQPDGLFGNVGSATKTGALSARSSAPLRAPLPDTQPSPPPVSCRPGGPL